MREECDALNPVFFHFITTKTPYVVMKYAMTADGKIATHTGASKWITGEAARNEVQIMRYTYSGIMVGIGTVFADDPMLNVRIEGRRSPVRIICDSRLRLPMESQIVKTAKEYETIVACGYTMQQLDDDEEASKRAEELENAGVEIVFAPGEGGETDLEKLMLILGERKIDSILLEGGGTLNENAIKCKIVNEVRAFIAPKIFAGAMSKSPVEGIGVGLPSEAMMMDLYDIKKIGEDILLSYKVKKEES